MIDRIVLKTGKLLNFIRMRWWHFSIMELSDSLSDIAQNRCVIKWSNFLLKLV